LSSKKGRETDVVVVIKRTWSVDLTGPVNWSSYT